MLDRIPTQATKHSNARTDGVSSSDVLAGTKVQSGLIGNSLVQVDG